MSNAGIARVCLDLKLLLTLPVLAVGQTWARESPTIDGQPVSWADYEYLIRVKCIPTAPEMTDRQLADKLNLDLPALSPVKAALSSGDPAALEQALAGYLNAKLPPRTVKPSGKPADNAAEADRWLGDDYEFEGRRYRLKDHVDWYANTQPKPGQNFAPFASVGSWMHPLCNAYQQTGDPRYAGRLLMMTRSLYHDARPPAQRPVGWHFLGPWEALWSSGRIFPGYLPETYQTIGASELVTNADRVMVLKMVWEHANFCAMLLNEPEAHNFSVHVCSGLASAATAFPEFRDSPSWLKLVADRYVDNMNLAVLADGASWERSAYHFAYANPYLKAHAQLSDAGAPLPDEFRRTVERMYDWGMWMLAPTLEWPLFGHSSLNDYGQTMRGAADAFPDRADFRYVATGGAHGAAPSRVARAMLPSGFVSMRSDWSREALQMTLRFNTVNEGGGGMHDMMSFSLWAYGRPWMTNPANSAHYEDMEYDDWVMDTASHNTILINWRRHDIVDNAGYLENFASLPAAGPGFTYSAAVSHAYESQHAIYRRAVLFVRPSYWLMHDVVEFPDRPHALQWYPYDVRWLGHFQPTELAVDPKTKAVTTAEAEGSRLCVIPAESDRFTFEQGKGPLVARMDRKGNVLGPEGRAMGPYISLRKKAGLGQSVAFAVLLCPVRGGAKSPVFESLPVQEADRRVESPAAVGCHVVQGEADDLLALAKMPAIRQYGDGQNGLTTDAEAAYVRRRGGQIVEAGMVGGRRLTCGNKTLLEAGADVRAVYAKYEGDRLDLRTWGTGQVAVTSASATKLIVQGRTVSAEARNEMYRITAGSSEAWTVAQPRFSTTPQDVCKAVGVVYGYRPTVEGKPETGYLGPRQSVVVSWDTSVPTDAMLEFRRAGEKSWLRAVDPELQREHRLVLGRIEPGGEYELRISGLDADGRLGRLETRLSKDLTATVRR